MMKTIPHGSRDQLKGREAPLTRAIQMTARYLLIAGLVLGTSSLAVADVSYVQRESRILMASANMGGLTIDTSTTDPAAIFNQGFSGSHVETVVGGGVNTGTWDLDQFSQLTAGAITVFGNTETTMTGDGFGILNATNIFEAQFESNGDTAFDLFGSYTGTTGVVGATDFVEVQLQQFDGVVFQNMFSTGSDNFDSGSFSGLMEDGELYRLSVLSRANVFGNEASASNFDIRLTFNPVPEPTSAGLIGAFGIAGLFRRKKRT